MIIICKTALGILLTYIKLTFERNLFSRELLDQIMRLRFTFLTLGCANADENKKFVHKDSFMNKSTPEWWGNHSAEKRAKTYFQNALPKFLSTWNIDSDVVAWESKMRALYRTQLNLRFLIDEGKCGKEVMPAEITENDERRRRSVLNALLDRENIDLDPLEESDQIDTQRKIKGEILSDDLDKIFQNMARYVLEEVLKAQNGKRCNKIGYKMVSIPA